MVATPTAALLPDDDNRSREFEFSPREFDRVRTRIQRRAGIVLADSKQDMVYSRLARRIRALGMSSFREYLDHIDRLDDDDDEIEAFTNALTTNLTSFFREPHHFDILRQHLDRCHDRPIRIWCAAASTGEEPYSIAMSVAEHFRRVDPPVEIVATDIDTQVLATANAGIYSMDRVEKLDAQLLRRYFRRGTGARDGQCRVIDELRRLISFRQLNLLDARYSVNGRFDAVFCRNVMIYFDKSTQLEIIKKIVPLMQPHALFFAGHSETYFQAAHLIEPIGRTVYRLKSVQS